MSASPTQSPPTSSEFPVSSPLFDALPAWLWPFRMLDYYTRQCKRCGQVQSNWEDVEDGGFNYIIPGWWRVDGDVLKADCPCHKHAHGEDGP